MSEGLLDSNVFIHAQTTDHHSEECRRFLAAVEEGAIQVRLEPLVLHELTYALKRYRKQMTRQDIGDYLLTVLSWPGIQGDRATMIEAVERWQATETLSFVDAYLSSVASRRQCPVYSKNVRDFTDQSVDVRRRLPLTDRSSSD